MQDHAEAIVSPAAADGLIAAHDGDVALLYIYIKRVGSFDAERAARDLCRTRGEIAAAWEKLRRMGLAQEVRALPAVQEGLPQYTAADLSRRSAEDGAFSAILAEARSVMAKNLSSNDMRVLFGIYDYLALPPDVILVLLHYCGEKCDRLYAGRRSPTIKSIEQEAYRWANREIVTLDMAEEYIARENERLDRGEQIKKLLAIQRELTPTERRYIGAWVEAGFDDEVISLAYDRTVTQTGAMKWPYMARILQSWQEKGLFTVEDIEAKDGRGSSRRGAPVSRDGGKRPVRTDDIDRLLNKI